MPSSMFTPAFKRDEFEKKIFAYYAHHSGKSDMIVRLLYLQYVRQVRPAARGALSPAGRRPLTGASCRAGPAVAGRWTSGRFMARPFSRRA